MAATAPQQRKKAIMRAARVRHWFFTDFDVSEERKALWEAYVVECTYICIGLETCPSTGRKHFQGWFTTKTPRAEGGIKAQFPGIHIEKVASNSKDCIEYCTKEQVWLVRGEPILTPSVRGAMGGSASAARAAEAIAIAKSGDQQKLETEFADLWMNRNSFFKDLIEKAKKLMQLSDIKNVWISGPPGCGKTRWVHDNVEQGQLYNKQATKWWDHYDGQGFVLIDDVTPDNFKGLHLSLLEWADRYPFRCEIKGGSIFIRPKHIIVTSNYTLEEVLTKSNVNMCHDALQRRFPLQVDLTDAMDKDKMFKDLTSDVFANSPCKRPRAHECEMEEKWVERPMGIPTDTTLAPIFKKPRMQRQLNYVPEKEVAHSAVHGQIVTDDDDDDVTILSTCDKDISFVQSILHSA